MTLYCSCCGKRHSFSYSAHNVLRTVYTLGWGSYGSAIYCPECTRTWDERNVGRPMPGPDNTIGLIDSLYRQERSIDTTDKRGNIMKPGDKVVMNNNYHVAEANKGKVWTVVSEPWNCCGTLVVKLEGKTGGYAVDGLDLVEETPK